MMKNSSKIQELPGFVKDPVSNGLLNTNRSAFASYKASREKSKIKNQELEDLKNDVTEIKNLLQQLLNRG